MKITINIFILSLCLILRIKSATISVLNKAVTKASLDKTVANFALFLSNSNNGNDFEEESFDKIEKSDQKGIKDALKDTALFYLFKTLLDKYFKDKNKLTTTTKFSTTTQYEEYIDEDVGLSTSSKKTSKKSTPTLEKNSSTTTPYPEEDEELDDTNDKFAELEEKVNQFLTAWNEFGKKVDKKHKLLEARLEVLEKNYTKLNQQNEKNQLEIDSLKSKVRSLQKDISKNNNSFEELYKLAQENAKTIKELKENVESLSNNKSDNSEECENNSKEKRKNSSKEKGKHGKHGKKGPKY